jgi:hypothetical protein
MVDIVQLVNNDPLTELLESMSAERGFSQF